ncbi:4Fe-4S dicluster domain-containing protein [Helicobacter sp. 11S03491-1]|uniref:4Fe-4S dicluster domain-containing protein n=1 Tax=Helicobacter sp. 11S03491-1 TaxID=1476196 RepID=UPI000BA58693|nr:4Fe-4S dicluster domain-containing protein [Helicobacter sp. 11S03491-1]PAF43826.1 hypothetical protein BKH45_00750 [Helicobacter sp. 11S03491-1]
MDLCEFLLINDDNQFDEIKPLLEDSIQFSSSPKNHAVVSNYSSNCDIYAPEINWYLKNSKASPEIKAQNIKRMYYSRMARYEYGTDRDFSTPTPPTLLIIGENEEAKDFLKFVQKYKKTSYEAGLIPPKDILSISGSLGEFQAKFMIAGEVKQVCFGQGVIFYEDKDLVRFMGIEKANDYKNPQALLEKLDSRVGTYHYKTTITYQTQSCQYHHRRPDKNQEGYCHKCVNVCPTFGATKDDSLMELNFSQLDCIGCGGCVAVCPSGAIDYAPFSMEAFDTALKHYHQTQILLIAEPFLEDLEDFEIPEHISPLIINREKFLSEAHILALLQESGASCVYYSQIISRPSSEAITLINDIYQKIYQKKGFYVAKNIKELRTHLKSLQPIQSYSYTPSPDEHRRKHFSERLRFAIKDNDYGKVSSGISGELIRYGQIHINQETCTLCMSCVGACNVGSLSGDGANFSLLFNASVCTTCGYCLDSCPEDAISLELSGISLNPTWFENKIMAQDKIFTCVECGKGFATQKSIEKIKSIMNPLFKNDPLKLKTLECCPDCKVKIMFANHFEKVV